MGKLSDKLAGFFGRLFPMSRNKTIKLNNEIRQTESEHFAQLCEMLGFLENSLNTCTDICRDNAEQIKLCRQSLRTVEDNQVKFGESTASKLKEIKLDIENLKNQNECIGEKLSNEINDQLNCILGWTNLVSTDKTLTPNQQNEYMNLIYEHSDQLSHLANDVLRLARIDAHKIDLQMATFCLHEFCQDIILLRMNNTHPNVELYLEGDSPNLLVYTDQQKLYQVILNLLSNAQKFTNKGHIKLAYSVDEEQNMINFIVEDTGLGMPPRIHTYLFERFYKANTFTDGPGLGLSICKAYIEAMGGTIQFTSSEGRGTRFHFSIRKEPIPAGDVALDMHK